MKTPIWEPSAERIKKATMTRFIDYVNKRYGLKIERYNELHEWSINSLEDFWAAIWDFGEIIASKPYDAIMTPGKHMIETKWFPKASDKARYKELVMLLEGNKNGKSKAKTDKLF